MKKMFEVLVVPFDKSGIISLGWVYAKSVDDEFVTRRCNAFLKRWITTLGYNPSKFNLVSDPYRIKLYPLDKDVEVERFENKYNRIIFERCFIGHMKHIIYNHSGDMSEAKLWINQLEKIYGER